MSKKIVLITGTNSGFGWLTANTVASLGHQVYATMRDTEGKNAEKANELSKVKNIIVLDVNLTDETSVKNAVERIIAKEGTIDVLVNNAGFSRNGVAESFTKEDLQEMLDINLIAPWSLIKAVLPSMREKSEGLIINITSGFGRFGFPFAAMYSSSKFAFEGLSEGLHYELRPLGVDVAIVQPGAFPTEMSQKLAFGSDSSVNEGYSAIADFPNKMGAAVGQMFETLKPNPQDVADAIVGLIDLPKGQRPLRTVVDPFTGAFVKAANDAVKAEYEQGIVEFGMKDLLI
ncbi:SDR family oxidoreductase [Chryseobacterium wangxinyae]|uniref:SDR family oxidoreductase n=1 Tax=Chryseobacterium sp. CY350 TaxID=2997336 RepID=UPI00226D77AB|nr:SDR family oxidoreductase [Chryseobacterium sp. CY350]MCY0979297.1 SDR family oxidoreductase [Chryseobacterium sp. CY350]WBZ95929.1 SDR family oxidoreductase [Chryseobacterium sp. CY350]